MDGFCYCFPVEQQHASGRRRVEGGGQQQQHQLWSLCSEGTQWKWIVCLQMQTSFSYIPPSKCDIKPKNPSKSMCDRRPSSRDMMVHSEPREWLPAAHKRPRNDSHLRVCKLPTKPLFPFKSLIRCWESITPGPVWRVSLARLCMVWKPACLLRFWRGRSENPNTRCVCACVFPFYYQKQNKTGDVDSTLRPRLYVCWRWRWGMWR